MAESATIKARITLDDRQFKQGVTQARDELGRFVASSKDAGNSTKDFGISLGAIKWGVFVAGALEAAKALLGVANSAVETAVKYDSLTRALASTNKSAAETQKQLLLLKEAAKAPGLGFEEAAQGAIRLKAVGFSFEGATRSLKAFGNAISAAGGGKQDLDGAILGLQQLASRGKVTADNINQIAQRIPQLRTIMKSAFGTSDTEAIQKQGVSVQKFVTTVIGALEKLPKVAGGAQNALDNFGDARDQFMGSIGKIVLPDLTKSLDAAANWLEANGPAIQKRLSETWGSVKEGIAAVKAALASDTGKAFINGLKDAGAMAMSLVKTLVTGAASIKQFFASTEGQTAITGLTTTFKGLASAAGTVTTFLVEQWGKVSGWFVENMPLIERTVKTVINTIQELWERHGQQILSIIEPIWEIIKGIIGGAVTAIGGILKTGMQIITGDWGGAWNSFGGVVSTIWETIKNTVSNGWELVKNALVLGLDALDDLGLRIIKAGWHIGETIVKGIVEKFANLWVALENTILDAPQSIWNAGKAVGQGILYGIELAITGKLPKWIAGQLGGLWNEFQRWIKQPGVSGSGTPASLNNNAWNSFLSANAQVKVKPGSINTGMDTDLLGNPMPKRPAIIKPSFPSGGLNDFAGLGGDAAGDDKEDKKAKRAHDKALREAKQHAKNMLEARKDFSDKLAEISMSDTQFQMRRLNQDVALAKKQGVQLSDIKLYYAQRSSQIAFEASKEQLEILVKAIAERKKVEQAAWLDELTTMRGNLTTITDTMSSDHFDQEWFDTQREGMLGKRKPKGLAPTIMPRLNNAQANNSRIRGYGEFLGNQFRGFSGENILKSLGGGRQGMRNFWQDFVSTGRDSLYKLGWQELIQPKLKGLFTDLANGLKGSLSGLVQVASTIINAVQGLMAAAGGRGKGRQLGAIIGGVVGLGASILTGGAALPFISAGMNFGQAVAGGNFSEIIGAGLSTYGSIGGEFRGAGKSGGGIDGLGTGIRGSQGGGGLQPTFVINNNFRDINEAGNFDQFNDQLGASVADALKGI